MLKGSDPDRSKSHIRDPTDAAATARKSDPPVLRAGLPTTPFGFRNRTGVRGFFPGDRRYPGCGGEQAGAPRVDSYPNARSRPTGSRTPPPTRRAVVAGIRDEVLVWSPRASLVLIRSRRAGNPTPGSARVTFPHHAATETGCPEGGWPRRPFAVAPRVAARLAACTSAWAANDPIRLWKSQRRSRFLPR